MNKKLNMQTLARLEPAQTGQYIVRDDKLPGFFAVVGKKAITFTVQVDVRKADGRRGTRKLALGRYPEMTAEEARRLAAAAKVDILRAEPMRSGRPSYTLGSGWAALRELMVAKVEAGERSPWTLENYDRAFAHVRDWADKPLAELSDRSDLVQARFRAISRGDTIESNLKGGKGTANLVAGFIGRVYRYVRDSGLQKDLPGYIPSLAVKEEVHRLPRRKRALSAKDLPGWYAQLRALPNPVRQEFHLFNLLTGSRQTQLKELRWEDVDFEAGTVHFPKPKGGTERAYTIPMSDAMADCLRRAKAAGEMLNPRSAHEWVFPSDPSRSNGRADGGDPSPHMVEHKEERDKLSHWGSDLRRTYKTLSKEAGMPEFIADLFQNHAQGGVSRGYNVREAMGGDFLADMQEKMSAFLMERLTDAPFMPGESQQENFVKNVEK
ncbi:hypothetical protein EI983_18750 [Roseovarius faecimaris]|uniref:Tyr recombinase domain-containing protein n=1 Tax=Roseovarius faecimaris TaxID=2494550 RepID=A0A6I6IX76_9RHOB|nr:tyrosine-type recombinase/integrase [Roseovarius faecimaris]QGY00192.1 hypothetical protein EI983_18750 [Roseovarius faecimaris]